jgi:hypothetical protein
MKPAVLKPSRMAFAVSLRSEGVPLRKREKSMSLMGVSGRVTVYAIVTYRNRETLFAHS